MNLRTMLAAILVAILGLLFVSKAPGREIELSRLICIDESTEEFLLKLVPAQAKHLDDDLWFHWALLHNEREYKLAEESRREEVIGVRTETDIDYRYGSDNYYRDLNGNIREQVFHRVYKRMTGARPVMLYNPYCRKDANVKKVKEEGRVYRVQTPNLATKE